jgi:hypothetical protein
VRWGCGTEDNHGVLALCTAPWSFAEVVRNLVFSV